MQKAFEPLCHFPLSGPSRDQLGRGLRVTFHSLYAIYYLPQPEALVVIRVIHGARDISAVAARGGFTFR
jgi:toxin ParE1/3/4